MISILFKNNDDTSNIDRIRFNQLKSNFKIDSTIEQYSLLGDFLLSCTLSQEKYMFQSQLRLISDLTWHEL